MSLYHYAARPVRIIDGDTIVVDIDLGLGTWVLGQRLRLFGIDCPERGTPEGDTAQIATAYWIGHGAPLDAEHRLGISTFKAADSDKREEYGRWLAVVYPDITFTGVPLNDYLVDNGYAVRYRG